MDHRMRKLMTMYDMDYELKENEKRRILANKEDCVDSATQKFEEHTVT